MEYPAEEFNQWSETYDQDVLVNSFPFEGYERTLDGVLTLADAYSGQRILDIGTGTGNLAARFLARGCKLYATDFSLNMVVKARKKLPQAHFVIFDLREGMPFEQSIRKRDGLFDCIVSAYVFHHFPLEKKIVILEALTHLLVRSGRIVVADIAFQDLEAKRFVRQAAGYDWEEEHYWIADRDLPVLWEAGFDASFYPVSTCGGVFRIQPR